MHLNTIPLSTLALYIAAATASPYPIPDRPEPDLIEEAMTTINERYPSTAVASQNIRKRIFTIGREFEKGNIHRKKLDEIFNDLEDMNQNVLLLIVKHAKRDIEETEEEEGDVEATLAHALEPLDELTNQLQKLVYRTDAVENHANWLKQGGDPLLI